jgi:hypothetical protein
MRYLSAKDAKTVIAKVLLCKRDNLLITHKLFYLLTI